MFKILRRNFRLIIFLNSTAACLLLVAVFSCSPQKRLNRLVRKNPELSKIDTLEITTTVSVPEVFKVTNERLVRHDTVIIREGHSEVKYYYDTHTDSIYIDQRCKEVEKTIIKKVPVEKVIYRNPTIKEQLGFLWPLWVIVVIYVAIRLFNYAMRKKRE